MTKGTQIKPISGGVCSVIQFGPETKEEVRKSLELYIYLGGMDPHLSIHIRVIIVISYYIGSKNLVHEPIVPRLPMILINIRYGWLSY